MFHCYRLYNQKHCKNNIQTRADEEEQIFATRRRRRLIQLQSVLLKPANNEQTFMTAEFVKQALNEITTTSNDRPVVDRLVLDRSRNSAKQLLDFPSLAALTWHLDPED